ncbi:hypothetical protein EZJ19_14470 [Parasulfuritortus cantonensis]|uniref:Transmembrane protein n=1 Tax=Parasulfuritortus cantonensis TaxID=2528202 RepID=A0A4R1B1P7_9PROT|nr:hypothetical protein [Parasulfuritortus cantonensis]TCJ11721.1 hypothetical protein EZJ19_14470 [Parasulfuritortus cantonensis]
MTQDFRQPAAAGAGAGPGLAPQQRAVLTLMRVFALLFVLVGAWFWLMPPASLVADQATLLGVALMVAGASEFASVAVLGRYWQRKKK